MPRKPATPTPDKPPRRPPRRPTRTPPATPGNPRLSEDQRWQHTVRFNWDNGGRRGGGKSGRK